MKIAIVGSSGYIASFLIEYFQQDPNVESILKIDQTAESDIILDLQHPEILNYEVLKNIDIVLFTAAISSPDKCATDFDFCWSINVIGTKYFIQKAIDNRCKVLFFSSDATYGDIPGYIYNENSETRAVTPYGRMKKAVEDEFSYNSYFKTIRLSYVVSEKDRFVEYCLNSIRRREIAEVFHPFYRNCIVVSDVVKVVVWFVNHWQEYSPFVLNVAGKELVSRVRIADEINRYFGDKLKYTIVQPKAEFYMNRPRATQMQSLYLQKYCILEDNSFTEKIQKELEKVLL